MSMECLLDMTGLFFSDEKDINELVSEIWIWCLK